jgi:hypothetical protein
MKYLKFLGLAAVMVAALMASAGTASATVLCKVTETPCAAFNEYPLGTFVRGSLEMGTSAAMKTTDNSELITCSIAHVSGTLESKGSGSETIHQEGSPKNISYDECTYTMDTLKGGEIELHHISGTDNGTVIIKAFETTVNILELSCIYGYGKGVDVGVLTGGAHPTMDVKAVLSKTGGGFLCPTTVMGEFDGSITEPEEGFYIEDE